MKYIILTLLAVLFSAPALAQLSVTAVGATDAATCYQNARNQLSTDAAPCDAALGENTLTRRDRMKTLVNRGIIRNRNGDLEAAINDFNQALDIDAKIGEAYLNRGNSYFLAKRYDLALADYKKALALNVSEPWSAWYNIGLVYEAENDQEQARTAFQKALGLNPDFSLAKSKLE